MIRGINYEIGVNRCEHRVLNGASDAEYGLLPPCTRERDIASRDSALGM
jgi:hypothetical protein